MSVLTIFGRWFSRGNGERQRRPRFRREARARLEFMEDRNLLSTIAALTANQQLLRFDSSRPGEILGQTTITGLQTGETILGIDVRPATSELYGLGSTGRLYVINAVTGSATQRAVLTADPTDVTDPFTSLTGTNFAIDFNPVPDRLRIVSDGDQNLRVNPVTGAVITDGTLAYAVGDANAGANPDIADIAYANNVAGATSTTLYDIDRTLGVYATQNPPNSGTLNTAGTRIRSAGFDIGPDGTAFVADVLNFGTPVTSLVTINPTTGALVQPLGYIGDGSQQVIDIAVLPSVQFSAERFTGAEGSNVVITVTLTDRPGGTVAVDYSTFPLTASSNDFVPVSGSLTFAPGETSKSFTVAIRNDNTAEGDEFFGVQLNNAAGAVVGGPGVSLVRISANDGKDKRGPVILQAAEIGPSRAITGFTLRFNEDLNPASAQNLANYAIRGVLRANGRKFPIALTSAVYNAVERTVTLQVAQPFDQTLLREINLRVSGARNGVRDVAGNRLDGDFNGKSGDDAVVRFNVVTGTTLRLRDGDGDRATLSIQNGGRLDGVTPFIGKRQLPFQVWLVDPVSQSSVVSGSLATNGRTDGLFRISEIIGLDHSDFAPLLGNSSFRLNRLTFSVDATGRV